MALICDMADLGLKYLSCLFGSRAWCAWCGWVLDAGGVLICTPEACDFGNRMVNSTEAMRFWKKASFIAVMWFWCCALSIAGGVRLLEMRRRNAEGTQFGEK